MHNMNDHEEWKPIPGFEGYYDVSDHGRVRSHHRGGRVLRQLRASNGYTKVALNIPGEKQKQYSTHRLVLRAFVGPCPARMEACHNNGVRDDNRLSNLRWDTRANNFRDRDLHGNTARGERSPFAKFTEDEVLAIREEYAGGGVSQRALAARYGVAKNSIAQIVRRKTWTHI